MSSLYVNGETGQVGIGTSQPSNLLHVEVNGNTPGNVEIMTRIENVEFPPVATSNVGFVADYEDVVASIDVGTPMTLVEFPPVGLTSATTTAGPITINVSGAFYGNGDYIVSASSVFDANHAPWESFNKLTANDDAWSSGASTYSTSSPFAATSGGPTLVSGVSYTGSWLQIQLPSNTSIKSYSLSSRLNAVSAQSPATWVIAGSTTGTTWTLLDLRAVETSWVARAEKHFSISSVGSYNYYRIIITNVTGANAVVSIGEWKLFADIPLPTTAREYPPLPMTANTSYLNGTYWEGSYVASESAPYVVGATAYAPFSAFNKSLNEFWIGAQFVYNSTSGVYTGTVNTFDVNNNKYAGEWLQIYFQQPIVLTSYLLSPRTGFEVATSPTTFWILGSQNGITWNLINTQTAITWSTSAQTFYVASVLSFRYFRLVTSVTGNAGRTDRSVVALAEWKLFGTQSTYPKYRATLPTTTSTYSTGTYATYANTIYNATTVDATPPLFLTDKTLTNPWRTGGSNYTSTIDASPTPTIFFELPSAIRLDTYTMSAPDISSAPSTWNVYGSNLGAIGNWSLLDARSSITTAWQTSLTQTFANTSNETAYNFYKFDLLRNSSASPNVISLSELRLGGDKISPESRISVGPDGRVGINTPPALMDKSSALTVSGNMTVAGNINAGNLGMFRNRIINGDMRIDQRNAGLLPPFQAVFTQLIVGSFMIRLQPHQ